MSCEVTNERTKRPLFDCSDGAVVWPSKCSTDVLVAAMCIFNPHLSAILVGAWMAHPSPIRVGRAWVRRFGAIRVGQARGSAASTIRALGRLDTARLVI